MGLGNLATDAKRVAYGCNGYSSTVRNGPATHDVVPMSERSYWAAILKIVCNLCSSCTDLSMVKVYIFGKI